MSETKTLDVMLNHAKNHIKQVLGPRCDTIMSEVAVSVNWAEGKAEILVGVTGRNYPKRKGWQCGTADLVCLLKTGELLVADWKTGGTDGATEQLLSLASGLQVALIDEDTPKRPVRICTLKVSDDGVFPEEKPVSDDEIANHWMAMSIAWAGKDKAVSPVPGIHCTQLYCPHLAYCPGIASTVSETSAEDGLDPKGVQKLVPASLLNRKLTGKPSSDMHAGHIMARVAAARRQCKYYETMMRQHIAKGGRVISGNYEWKETGAGFRWVKYAS